MVSAIIPLACADKLTCFTCSSLCNNSLYAMETHIAQFGASQTGCEVSFNEHILKQYRELTNAFCKELPLFVNVNALFLIGFMHNASRRQIGPRQNCVWYVILRLKRSE